MKKKEYLGIFLGGIYGLFFRFLGEDNNKFIFDEINIFSITFICILPIVIGLIPNLIAKEEIQNSETKQILYPICSVLLFFIMAIASGLEDLICLLILSFPFSLIAGISGFILSKILKNRKSNKMYSIVLLPLLLLPIEAEFSNQKDNYQVSSEIIIEASKAKIWKKIIEVPEIKASEYDYGFYNYIGIPRPIKSELKEIAGEEYRIGHFTNNLKLFEKITQIDTLNFVEFKIELEKSLLRDLPTDKHILQSNYFKFDDISYTLVAIDSENTKLILSCNYSMNSKMNWYANFWAERIIKDFEVKLLSVLKMKIENDN